MRVRRRAVMPIDPSSHVGSCRRRRPRCTPGYSSPLAPTRGPRLSSHYPTTTLLVNAARLVVCHCLSSLAGWSVPPSGAGRLPHSVQRVFAPNRTARNQFPVRSTLHSSTASQGRNLVARSYGASSSSSSSASIPSISASVTGPTGSGSESPNFLNNMLYSSIWSFLSL